MCPPNEIASSDKETVTIFSTQSVSQFMSKKYAMSKLLVIAESFVSSDMDKCICCFESITNHLYHFVFCVIAIRFLADMNHPCE